MPFELSAANAVGYLRERYDLGEPATASLLGGGVSNTTVLVESGWERIVLKQSLPRLRVADQWLADRSRILRERDAIAALTPILPVGRVPRIVLSDDENFVYGMEAAPSDAADWKTRLLAGECDAGSARLAGTTLGLVMRATWKNEEFAERFGDQTAFEQLRTDAYYNTVGRRHPEIRAEVDAWIDEQRARRDAMVHGDWSPKNLLVSGDCLTAIDFECAHFGDPSYDAAFLTNHFVLKAFHRPEIAAHYLHLARVAFTWTIGLLPGDALAEFERNSARHLAFLLLARVDGKSPAEYITDEGLRDRIRQLALRLIGKQLTGIKDTLGEAERSIDRSR